MVKKTLFLILVTIFYFNSNNTNAEDIKGKPRSTWSATYYGNTYKRVRKTANGDTFNMNAMTCAAPKTYKFGTKLKITNINNNKSVIVVVTDRGGFGNRTIDLTHGAFGKIANHKSGRIPIKVEVVD